MIPAAARDRSQRWVGIAVSFGWAALAGLAFGPLYLRRCMQWGTQPEERTAPLAGDKIGPHPATSYTMAVTVAATSRELWRWLVQIGQGRGGFYTHEWVENLLGAEIDHADRIVSRWQRLAAGDRIRLTPDPYLGQPGQFVTVVSVDPEHSLVFKQRLPNGSHASWVFVLRSQGDRTTRLLMRRRSEQPTLFDRLMMPGYVFMDCGMLSGLRTRAEMAGRAGLAR